MGGIRGFLKSLEKSRKKQVLLFLTNMTVLIFIYLVIMNQFNSQILEDDFSWVYQIDNITETEDELHIKGWAFPLNKNAEQKNCEIILYDTKTGKRNYPELIYESREDVNEYFLCEYDYTESGFVAVFFTKHLQLENSIYQILLKPKGSKKAFETNVYYDNGKIMYVHPDEFVPLEVVGTDLENVVENGVLRVHRPDYGMYVYQYEGELYWIAELNYGFVNENTVVEYQVNTTQIDKLPKERLSHDWLWDNLGFEFRVKELLDWNTGKYRVAKYSLPIEYSITYISTGNNINGWLWKTNFRPWYDF